MTAGAMIAGSILLGRTLAPIDMVIGQWNAIAEAGQSWRRLTALLGEEVAAPTRMPLPQPKARVEVSQLSVIPRGAQSPTLRGVSFAIAPGEAVGVIGASGPGKSTLARAITAVWSPAVGQIRLDGAKLDQYDVDALGQYIGYMPQAVTLFAGTIAAIHVEEGARVAAGDVILRLEPGQLARDRAVAAARLFELRVRRARLEAERGGTDSVSFPAALVQAAAEDIEFADLLRGQDTLFSARRDTLTREIAQLRGRIDQIAAQIAALAAQEAALAEQLALVTTDLERQAGLLARCLIQSDPVLRPQRDGAQLRGSLGEVEACKVEAGERVIETELAILQLGTARREVTIAELRKIRVAKEELR